MHVRWDVREALHDGVRGKGDGKQLLSKASSHFLDVIEFKCIFLFFPISFDI